MLKVNITPRVYERYPRPSFGHGFARALDLFGAGSRLTRRFKQGRASDADALARDWAAVGNDLRRVMERAGIR